MQKNIVLVTLAVLFLVLFGCTLLPTDQKTVNELTALKAKYGVTSTFVSNTQTMSSYINEVTKLQSKTNTQLVRFELYSSQSFYYLLKANEAYDNVDYQNDSCKSIFISNSRKYALLAISSIEKAKNESNLSDSEKQTLRDGQIESLDGYLQIAQEINSALTQKCGKVL